MELHQDQLNLRLIEEIELYRIWQYAKVTYPTFDSLKQRYLDIGYIIYSLETEGIYDRSRAC